MDMARNNQIKVNDTVSAAQHGAVHQRDVNFSTSFGSERLFFSHFTFFFVLVFCRDSMTAMVYSLERCIERQECVCGGA